MNLNKKSSELISRLNSNYIKSVHFPIGHTFSGFSKTAELISTRHPLEFDLKTTPDGNLRYN